MSKEDDLKNRVARAALTGTKVLPPMHPKKKAVLSPAATAEARQRALDRHMDSALSKLLDEAASWDLVGGGPAPAWPELRDAIMQKIYAIEREFGRQEDD